MRNFRKTLTPILEIAALVLVLLDVGLGIGVSWLSGHLAELRDLERTANSQIQQAEVRVSRLQKFDAVLPGAQGQLQLFCKTHVPTRRQAYSRALHLVRVLSQDAGVQVTAVGYKPDPVKNGPLDRLDLNVDANGSFENLIKFGHSLETASDLLVLRDFNFAPGDSGQLALRVDADLYMNP